MYDKTVCEQHEVHPHAKHVTMSVVWIYHGTLHHANLIEPRKHHVVALPGEARRQALISLPNVSASLAQVEHQNIVVSVGSRRHRTPLIDPWDFRYLPRDILQQ